MRDGSNHLVINLVQLLPETSGGIETYSRELIPRVVDRLPDWQVTAFVNREGAKSFPAWDDRVDWREMKLSWFDRGKRLIWESTILPRHIRRLKPSLVHNMVNTACVRPGGPQLTTVFDATPQLHPPANEALPAKVFRKLLAASVRRTDAIVTISESAADDIAEAYAVDRGRIRVALLAARAPEAPLDFAALRAKFDIPPDAPYFLTPAARRPNKNIPALIEAFAPVAQSSGAMLLLPGADAGDDAELDALITRFELTDRVRMLGWISDAELDELYRNALALVFPSLAEGFGLPILEAMQCGCAVATSGVSSMPEVAGDAAIYFEPSDVGSIAAAMQRLIDQPELVSDLRRAGPARAGEFSWDRTADETVAIYQDLMR